jgi:hypothetical protein
MSNKRELKAFVRFDGSGRIVAGSLILRKNKPKVGKWQEIVAYECCNTPTTTIYPEYTIGQRALGGTIAYILQEGDPGYNPDVQHGFVATVGDLTETAPWGCAGTVIIGADGDAIGTGAQNTVDIVAGCSETGTAARLCIDLVNGGYSDWYLPSQDELNQLYLNRVAIGNFTNNYYISSTEKNDSNALGQNFNDGIPTIYDKSDSSYVRAIRTF